jgi:hypothetical protein
MNLPFNQDQAKSAARTALTALLGFAAGRKWLGEDTVALLGTLAPIAWPFIWGLLAHSDKAKVEAAAALPDVDKVVVKPTATNGVAAAVADPNLPKVVPAGDR